MTSSLQTIPHPPLKDMPEITSYKCPKTGKSKAQQVTSNKRATSNRIKNVISNKETKG